MPRAVPKQSPFKPDEIVTSWQAFSCDLANGMSLTVRRGTRLRGDNPAVRACPWNFVRDGLSDDEIPDPRRQWPRSPSRGRVRVRENVTAISYGLSNFLPGQTFVADPKAAEQLLADGFVELA